MEPSKALELLGDITYKPNFRLTANAYDRYERAIMLRVSYAVPESDVAFAPEYTYPASPDIDFIVLVGDCDDEMDFNTKVFACLLYVETHEAREFFSIGGNSYEKPFHPHTTAGIDQWNNRRAVVEAKDMPLNALVFERETK